MPFERGFLARGAKVGVIVLSAALLAACGGNRGGPATFQTQESGGWNPFGRGGGRAAAAAAPSVGVNGYLWRASLDTLAFMPLSAADPYGGVIITDWYTNPEQPNERFKATVYILDSRLRADGLNVAVAKQRRDVSGSWIDTEASAQTETDIENAILTRARQLRLSNVSG